MYRLAVPQGKLGVAGDLDWGHVLEALVDQRLQANGHGVTGMEQVVDLVTGRAHRWAVLVLSGEHFPVCQDERQRGPKHEQL